MADLPSAGTGKGGPGREATQALAGRIDGEEEIARKVIGAHAGRRHMTKIEVARRSVAVRRACGMEFADSGDRQDSGANRQGGCSF